MTENNSNIVLFFESVNHDDCRMPLRLFLNLIVLPVPSGVILHKGVYDLEGAKAVERFL